MDRDLWKSLKSQNEVKTISIYTTAFFLFDLALILFSWRMSSQGFIYFILSIPFLTFALLQLYLILHEATHSAVSEMKWLNNLVGHICGIFVLLPFLQRQTSHLLHHTWTGHPVKDPANNRMIKKFSVITQKEINFLEFVWKNWIPLIVLNDRIGLWKAPFSGSYSNGSITPRILQEKKMNYIYSFLYFSLFCTLVYFNTVTHFVLWYLSGFVLALFFEELVNLPHHAETPLLKPEDKALPYWQQHLVTHSCHEIPIWSKYILMYFNYHVAHHYFPNAPWYTLKKLDDAINIEKSEHHSTQNEFHWSIINRKKPLLSIMGHYFDRSMKNLDMEHSLESTQKNPILKHDPESSLKNPKVRHRVENVLEKYTEVNLEP